MMRDIIAITVTAIMSLGLVEFANAHGGDSTKIHACVRNSGANSGAVRIVGANDACRTGETPLHWARDQNSGDITAVLPGGGLVGGGTNGDVTLSVATPLNLTGSDPLAVVRGTNSGTPGDGEAAGMWGHSVSGAGVFGSSDKAGRGVVGISPSIGVAGGSSEGIGVYASGKLAGVSAEISGPTGNAVSGRILVASSAGDFGNGVYGASSGNGVLGETNTPQQRYAGIHGINPNISGYAGLFEGNAKVTRNLAVSGIISSGSDRANKENFTFADTREILERLSALRIERWNFKGEEASVRHLGPAAQDFRAAFGLGEDDLHIALVDADGVALAAIQALYQIVRERDAQLASLEGQNVRLEERLRALEQRMGATQPK